MNGGFWYYKIKDQEFGPIERDQLQELLNSGRLPPDALVFGEDNPDWTPAWQIPRFGLPPRGAMPILPGQPGYADDVDPAEEAPGPDLPPLEDPSIPQVRPLLRCCARGLDLALWIFPATVLFRPAVLLAGPYQALTLPALTVISWVFIESIFLSRRGATPGKWLFNIRLVNREGTNPTFAEALQRSITVAWRGVGLGVYVLPLLTGMLALTGLMRQGTTPWDKAGGFRVIHQAVGFGRGLLAVCVALFLILLGLIVLNPTG